MSSLTAENMVDRVEAAVLDSLRRSPDLSVESSARSWARHIEPLASPQVLASVTQQVVSNLTGLGVLDPLLNDPSITELMVTKGLVWVERQGQLHQVHGMVVTEAAVMRIVERVIAPLGLELNRAHPMVDARLADGSRLNVIIPPLAIDGPCLTVRRFAARQLTLADFGPSPTITQSVINAVSQRQNVLVSGSTGSGKTTLLNTVGSLCSPADRIVTIEDAAELRLPGDHVVRLEARPGAHDGSGKVTIRDLVRNALRMRPDRIIIGEVRGGEAFDMITALNTGHDGSMTTVHANSASDALRRLELMMLLAGIELPIAAVREQIASAIHCVIHVARVGDGRRQIVSFGRVRLINGSIELEPNVAPFSPAQSGWVA